MPKLEQVLITREIIVKSFKRFEVFIMPVLKFLLGFFVFSRINSIGYPNELLVPVIEAFPPTMLNMLFALLFTVMPTNMSWLLMIIGVTVQLSYSIEVAAAVFLFLIFVFIFYARMAPRESLLILFTLIAFHFRVPYLLPLLVGLYFPVTAIIPVVIGVFMHSLLPAVESLMYAPMAGIPVDLDLPDLIAELPMAFEAVYATLMTSITASLGWIFTSFIFAMIIIAVNIISRMAIDYSKEIAIGIGSVICIFGFIVLLIVTDESVNIFTLSLGTVLCAGLAMIVRFFDSVLDYQRAESVQFQDDNNFYYVRVVPKVVMTKRAPRVRRIRSQNETETASIETRPRPRPASDPDAARPLRPRRPRPDDNVDSPPADDTPKPYRTRED